MALNNLPTSNLLVESPRMREASPVGYQWMAPPLRLVLPYCKRDAEKALALLEWMVELNSSRQVNEMILVVDSDVDSIMRQRVLNAAQTMFSAVELEIQPLPRYVKWPATNNSVFFRTVRHLAKLSPKPWLWLETDVVPVRRDWLDCIEREYELGKRPFGGYFIESFGIVNGVAIYPHNAADWLTFTLSKHPHTQVAWDCAMSRDMLWFCHPMNHVIPNIWQTRKNGVPAILGGETPVWTKQLFEWVVTPHTALIHRCKDDRLIELARERLRTSV